MDPTVVLAEMRQIAARIMRHAGESSGSDTSVAARVAEDAEALSLRVRRLDEWLQSLVAKQKEGVA